MTTYISSNNDLFLLDYNVFDTVESQSKKMWLVSYVPCVEIIAKVS